MASNALSWRGRYDDLSITDASTWQMELVVNGIRRRSSGYGCPPSGFNRFFDVLADMAEKHGGMKGLL